MNNCATADLAAACDLTPADPKLPDVDGSAPLIPAAARTITLDQLAVLAQVSRRTLERWAAMNKVPGRIRTPGRTIRFNRAVIEKWLSGDRC